MASGWFRGELSLLTGMASTASLGLSGASGSASEGSECAVFSVPCSVGSWGLVGKAFSVEIGFCVEFWSSGIYFILSFFYNLILVVFDSEISLQIINKLIINLNNYIIFYK